MSQKKKIKSPPSPPPELKSRVISCLNKLSDRDTLAAAASDLDSIAHSLTPDSFSSFLSCIHSTDDSSKPPVRRHCVHILSLLSRSHGHHLSPHVPKMAAIIVRRLRDPDSAVRAACVAASAAIAANVSWSPLSALLKPLTEALTTEQDVNSQNGAAMCIAAAVEASPETEPEQLKRLLTRAMKLLRSEGFKAKAAVLGMVGSIVGVGEVASKSVLEWLVPLVMEFLSSEDWQARKAAAETLGKVAMAEKELATEHRASCLKCLEARRFDKVKIVRDAMNRSLDNWKEVTDAFEEISASSHSSSSPPINGISGCFDSPSNRSHDIPQKTSGPKKPVLSPTSRSSPSVSAPGTIVKKESLQRTDVKTPASCLSSRLERRKSSNWEVEIAMQQSVKSRHELDNDSSNDYEKYHSKVPVLGESQNKGNSRPETKRALYSKIRDDNLQGFGAFRPGSRVVPFSDPDILESASGVLCRGTSTEDHDNEKEMQELTMVRRQLAQIENQQSSLFELLQKFIGNSQNGMNYLETRVQGLELALEEISMDLGLSSGRFPNRDSAENTCCKLPGTDFLSSKFWRKGDSRHPALRVSSPRSTRPSDECLRPGSERFLDQNAGAFVEKRVVGDYSRGRPQTTVVRDVEKARLINANRGNGTTLAASLSTGRHRS